MTIKQQGGIFGRNPTFNDVTVDNELDLTNATIVGSPTFNAAQTIPSSLTITGENIDRLIKLDAVNKTIDTSTEWSSSGTTEFIQTMKARQTGSWRYVGLGQVGAELRFYNSNTNADVTTGEVFSINTGKSLIMSGGGNVVFNAGAGIDFSATSGTGTSELFDDYEEGTWTPVVNYSTSATGVAYSEQNGRYTKVGRMVTLEAEISLSNKGSGGASRVQITGMPFSSVTNQHVGSVEVRNTTLTTDGVFVELGRAGSTIMRVMRNVSGASASTINFADMTNTSAFLFTITYEAA